MKIKLLIVLLAIGGFCHAQSAVQSVNSGSLITAGSSVSIGEIVVNPAGPGQSASGIIGILAQINEQTLETDHFVVSPTVTVHPNPTAAKIFFTSQENLKEKSVLVYDNSGKLVLDTKISAENSVDLQSLSTGIFLIQFNDKTLQTFKIIKH